MCSMRLPADQLQPVPPCAERDDLPPCAIEDQLPVNSHGRTGYSDRRYSTRASMSSP